LLILILNNAPLCGIYPIFLAQTKAHAITKET
jgi:hypothetical protein